MSKTIKASAILRGLKSFAPDAKVQTGIKVPICSVWPPEKASKGFQIPLDDWMLEEYAAFDVSYMTGIENPDLGVYLMDAITPLSRFGQPVICSERSLP